MDAIHLNNVLDVQPGASIAEIKAAYHDLVQVWHPDRFKKEGRLNTLATQKMQEINEAYRQLMELAAPSGYVPLPPCPAQKSGQSSSPFPVKQPSAPPSRPQQSATGSTSPMPPSPDSRGVVLNRVVYRYPPSDAIVTPGQYKKAIDSIAVAVSVLTLFVLLFVLPYVPQ